MIASALKTTIPIDNTPNTNFQMGGRRKKMRSKCGGANEEKASTKVGAKVVPDLSQEDAIGTDYSILGKIPHAKDKDEDETIRLARIAEEGRGGPEQYPSMLQEEGRAGIPSFEVPKIVKGGASRKRKNRTKQRRIKSKKTRKGKSKKTRRGKY
jgi:hypothetical protein